MDAAAADLDSEQHVIAAAHHLVMALKSDNNFTDDVRNILSDLNVHLSQMLKLNTAEARNLREIEIRLMTAQKTITDLHSSHSKIWDSGPLIVLEYLQAIDEVQSSITSLETTSLSRGSRSKEIYDRAQSILQTIMVRLQKELIHILVQNKQCFGHEYASLPSSENPALEESYVSNEDESLENASQQASCSSEAEEDAVMDLIHPDVVPQIKTIAYVMFASGYGQEFCQVFTTFWRDTFAEYLTILDIEHLSIEDVLQMEWKNLNSRIRRWCVAIKRIIGIYLARAKHLFDQILGEHGRVSLMEASKASLLCLLNFGQAVSIGFHRPECLFCLLNMYEALALVIPDVDTLFPEGTGTFIKAEFHELLSKLGSTATVIFKEFEKYIASSSSTNPYTNGGIHPLTKYVVNYILCIAEYGDTLKTLLETQNTENSDGAVSAVGECLQSLTEALEVNLDKKSHLYKDSPLKHIFMMNNIHYMVEKIKSSKIHPYFGDVWIRSRIVMYKQHERCYERLSLGSILDLLREEKKAGKAGFKARCQAFATAFEDLYKNQTRWCVPNVRLREDLRISVSKMLVLAYRNFVCEVVNNNCEKHVKYSEQDLAMYVLDLLEGTAKSLNHLRKR